MLLLQWLLLCRRRHCATSACARPCCCICRPVDCKAWGAGCSSCHVSRHLSLACCLGSSSSSGCHRLLRLVLLVQVVLVLLVLLVLVLLLLLLLVLLVLLLASCLGPASGRRPSWRLCCGGGSRRSSGSCCLRCCTRRCLRGCHGCGDDGG